MTGETQLDNAFGVFVPVKKIAPELETPAQMIKAMIRA